MNNLQIYLLSLEREEIWMHFFANACKTCPAKAFCDAAPEGTCCRENFMVWAEGRDGNG